MTDVNYYLEYYLPRSFRPAVQWLFEPAHPVDRVLRPKHWTPRSENLSDKEMAKYLADFTPEELEDLHQLRQRFASEHSVTDQL